MAHPYWPLFDLVVRSPRLEIRLAREEEFVEKIELIDTGGIHDPATMTFSIAWTDTPLPQRHRDSYQWWWGQRTRWRSRATGPSKGPAVLPRRPHHRGPVDRRHAVRRTLRAVNSGSWLGRAYQGQGYGKEMRAAMLHLAFDGLGAAVAYSGAFFDNAASLATSKALGYRENGRERQLRRGVSRPRSSTCAWTEPTGRPASVRRAPSRASTPAATSSRRWRRPGKNRIVPEPSHWVNNS